MKTAIIINPAAANGRLGRVWPRLEPVVREALGDCEALRTERRGHACELARAALQSGCERIVSVGGDGTHNEVLNGFFDGAALVQPDAILGFLPFGTGGDFVRSIRIPKGPAAIQALRTATLKAVDVGRVRFRASDGTTQTRHFMNITDFGIGGEVVRRVNASNKFFGGFASFLWGVLTAIATHTNAEMELTFDGEPLRGKFSNIIVAKGQYYGGGMHVAPFARLDNGLFDVYVIGDVGKIESFVNLPKVYLGGLHRRVDKVRYIRAKHIDARSNSNVLVNIDGEQPGGLPLEISLVPKAIRLIVGPTFATG
ncbi:MAG TPA: diacylglycerol kinase family lipid kinase [Candidatus Hydrogenedentes bacterium]|nr:diacylglycerol kinase family lipid kinase [Candidatus Hydrogenedentota bacterium]